MSGVMLPIYRLPTATAVRIGQIRVVTDRNNQRYVDGSKVVSTTPSGNFLILTLANDSVYYVKADEYDNLPQGGSKSATKRAKRKS